jgi:hypothetical protein
VLPHDLRYGWPPLDAAEDESSQLNPVAEVVSLTSELWHANEMLQHALNPAYDCWTDARSFDSLEPQLKTAVKEWLETVIHASPCKFTGRLKEYMANVSSSVFRCKLLIEDGPYHYRVGTAQPRFEKNVVQEEGALFGETHLHATDCMCAARQCHARCVPMLIGSTLAWCCVLSWSAVKAEMCKQPFKIADPLPPKVTAIRKQLHLDENIADLWEKHCPWFSRDDVIRYTQREAAFDRLLERELKMIPPDTEQMLYAELSPAGVSFDGSATTSEQLSASDAWLLSKHCPLNLFEQVCDYVHRSSWRHNGRMDGALGINGHGVSLGLGVTTDEQGIVFRRKLPLGGGDGASAVDYNGCYARSLDEEKELQTLHWSIFTILAEREPWKSLLTNRLSVRYVAVSEHVRQRISTHSLEYEIENT